MGRPEMYTPELGTLLCERMIEVGSLSEACDKDARLPERHVVYAWCVRHPDFDAEFARARERLMDRWSDDIITIADDPDIEPNVARVRCDNRRWLMSKLAWRRYGDKLVHSGDAENPIVVLSGAVALDRLSAPELDALERLAQARLAAIDVVAEDVPK